MFYSQLTNAIEKTRFCRPPLLIGAVVLFLVGGSCGLASAATWCVSPGGKSGCAATIGAAVAAASSGDTIEVRRGIYKEDVRITKALSLVAQPNGQVTIDADGMANGIVIDGMAAAPHVGVTSVLVSGFTVRNANFEGIVVVNASDVTLLGNHVVDNNRALDIADGACPGIPAFETNEGDDCGEGIHLMGAADSSIVGNEVDHNAGGILISDETGTSRGNLISGNSVHDNPFDCGITMASHGPATSVVPSATVSFGVVHNTIAHNVSEHNGFEVPGAGAGVGIFAPFPGTTAAHNVVIDNDLRDNGMPGFAMHNHASAPAPAPPVNLDGNVIVGNHFSGNAADTADAATPGPTGINIYSTAPVSGTVISQNTFEDEAVDIAYKAPSGHVSAHLNNFSVNATGVDNMGTGTVGATENWWHCPKGPGGNGACATVSGPKVSFSPWLGSPFAGNSN